MTKREVVDLLEIPSSNVPTNGIEQWEFHKIHFSGAVTTILLDFQHDKVISFNSYAGNTPSRLPAISDPVRLLLLKKDLRWLIRQTIRHGFRNLYQKVKDKPFKGTQRLKILREAARQSDFTCDENRTVDETSSTSTMKDWNILVILYY